jgi:hypothetical protein
MLSRLPVRPSSASNPSSFSKRRITLFPAAIFQVLYNQHAFCAQSVPIPYPAHSYAKHRVLLSPGEFFHFGNFHPAQPLPESVLSPTFRWFPHLHYVSLSIADFVRWRPDRPRGAPVLSSSPSLRMFLGESPSEEKQTARASHQRRFAPSR